jgi:hypothetical protein
MGLVVLLFADLAAAQQEAGILGQLKDESGGVLPGVTVTASSPSLQAKEVTDVTNAQGEYRLTPLPIGTYAVVYSLAGFQTVRHEAVRLEIGGVVRLDVVMKIGALGESITVSGATPVVDVTSTTASTHLTLETIELTPTSRNGLLSLVAQAPGVRTPGQVDVGGGSVGDSPRLASFAQPDDNNVVMEGLLTTDVRTGSMGHNYFDYSAIEEARVETIANGPEVSTRGPSLELVLKSGGNELHGSGEAAYTSHRFESNNIGPALRAKGITSGNPLQSRSDVGGTLGGRIIRDRLWFFTAARYRPQNTEMIGSFKPDGSPGIWYRNETLLNQKLSYQMTKSNKLVFWHQWGLKAHGGDNLSPLIAYETRSDRRPAVGTDLWKTEWQAVRGNSLVMSLLVGRANWIAGTHATGVTTSDALKQAGVPGGYAITHTAALNDPDFGGGRPSYRDIATLRQFGSPPSGGDFGYNTHWDYKGKVSWFRPDLFLGNHEFKGGAEYFPASFIQGQGDRGGAGQYQLLLSNGAPFQINFYNYPTVYQLNTAYTSGYGEDKWTIGRRLTLDLGLRYERDTTWIPHQCRLVGPFATAGCTDKASLNPLPSFAPRLYFSYDVGGDGQTAVKGGWGRFYNWRYINQVQFLNPFSAVTSLYRWHDTSGAICTVPAGSTSSSPSTNCTLNYVPGSVNLDPNGGDFISTTGAAAGGGAVSGINNPNEKPTGTDQYSVTIERQLGKNFGVRASGIYIRTFDEQRVLNVLRPYDAYNIPITRPDPGPDGILGTGDDPGTMLTYYDYSASLAGLQNQKFMYINDPRSSEKHKGIELQLTKRIADRWQFLAAYSATTTDSLVGHTATGNVAVNFTPNDEINTGNHTTQTTIRLSGLYRLPFDVNLSANFQSISGDPQARQVLLRGPAGSQIPTLVVNVAPLGSLNLPTLNVLDFRFEKGFTLASRRLSLRVNLFNATNVGTVLTRVLQSGPTYLLPTTVMRPRIVEFSLAAEF